MGHNEYLASILIAERLREAREHAARHHRLAGARPVPALRAWRARIAGYGAEASSLIKRWRNWRPAYRSFTPMRSSRPWARLSPRNRPETP